MVRRFTNHEHHGHDPLFALTKRPAALFLFARRKNIGNIFVYGEVYLSVGNWFRDERLLYEPSLKIHIGLSCVSFFWKAKQTTLPVCRPALFMTRYRRLTGLHCRDGSVQGF